MATKIAGNTFKVKDQLRKLGGKWDGLCWVVPDDKADAAWALVGGRPSAPIARGIATLSVHAAPSRGVFGVLTVKYEGGPAARFGVNSAEAVAEFRRVADPANTSDFGGELHFNQWVDRVFCGRPDVEIWV